MSIKSITNKISKRMITSCIALTLSVLMIASLCGKAAALQSNQNITLLDNATVSTVEDVSLNVSIGVNIYINDVSFTPTDVNGNEVKPFLYNGTTYLPARAISNVFGANIQWNSETKSVLIDTSTAGTVTNDTPTREDTALTSTTVYGVKGINIYVNNTLFIPTDVNGTPVAVYIINGTTFLPVRAIASVFNTDIAWEGTNSGVYVGTHVEPVVSAWTVVYEEQFQIYDPFAEVLSDELLAQIGSDGFSGTDTEIAQQIFTWQEENMIYISDTGSQMDASYQGRWNLFLPGIYPASELVVEHINDAGKIYGICSDYTLIFCVIGNSYGLETRCNTFTKYKFSEVHDWVDPATTRGLATEEYVALNEKMEAHGMSLTQDQIDRVARESYVHARPEIKIDGQWISFDGAGIAPTGDYLEADNYEALPYYAQYSNVLLYAPAAFAEDTGLNLENLAELLSYCPQIEYDGITDEAGKEHRAANFTDMCRGLGLLPYYNSIEKLSAFLEMTEDQAIDALDDSISVATAYEDGTGKKFYILADFYIYVDEEIEVQRYVTLYNALTGGDLTEDEFNDYIK